MPTHTAYPARPRRGPLRSPLAAAPHSPLPEHRTGASPDRPAAHAAVPDRITLSRGAASPPQRRHHRANSSVSTIRQANTARPSSSRCPTTCRPSSSSRQNEPGQGARR